MLSKKTITVATDSGGDSVSIDGDELSLGIAYARVVRLVVSEPNSDDADVHIEDDEGQYIFSKASTAVPFNKYIVVPEGSVQDSDGEAAAADSAISVHPVAKSPLNISLANGGVSRTYTISIYIERSFH